MHPDYIFDGIVSSERVRNDLALLELDRPINNTTVTPFGTAARPRKGDQVGVVSYAKDRSEAPSLQKVSLGTALGAPLARLRAELVALKGAGRVQVDGVRNDTGAKFIKP